MFGFTTTLIPPTPTRSGGFVVVPTATKTYYVATGGDDGALGTSDITPFATLNKALLSAEIDIAAGTHTHIALNRGNSFALPTVRIPSGVSINRPLVIKAYGTGARPYFDCGNGNGLTVFGLPVLRSVWFVGLELEGTTYAGLTDSVGCGPQYGENILIEDCKIHKFRHCIAIDGKDSFGGLGSSLVIRRNILADAYTTDPNGSSGVIAGNWNGITIRENYITRCGVQFASAKSHGLYLWQGSNGNNIVEDNMIVEMGGDGISFRPGGQCNGNLFIRCPLALAIGVVDGSDNPTYYPNLDWTVRNNTILEGYSIAGNPNTGGRGISITRTESGLLEGNIIGASIATAGGRRGIDFDPTTSAGIAGSHVHNVHLLNNIVRDWIGSPITGKGTQVQLANITGIGNHLQCPSGDWVIDSSKSGPPIGFGAWSGNKYWTSLAGNDKFFANGGYTITTWKAATGDSTSTLAELVYTGSVAPAVWFTSLTTDYATWKADQEARVAGSWLSTQDAAAAHTWAAAQSVPV